MDITKCKFQYTANVLFTNTEVYNIIYLVRVGHRAECNDYEPYSHNYLSLSVNMWGKGESEEREKTPLMVV